MAEKIITKPKDWPVNPYAGLQIKSKNPFVKIVTDCCYQVVEDRDQQVLRLIKKQSELNHNSWWSNRIKYPRVPFDPFFIAIRKRDKQIRAYLLRKWGMVEPL